MSVSNPGNALPAKTDLIILGSGVAGLTAALTASLAGLRCVVLEHTSGIGGTSARSSGTVWVPGNMYMRDAGIEDAELAARYVGTLVGNRGPEPMWRRFLEVAPRMQQDLAERARIDFRPFKTAPDYRQDVEGAASGWRPLEPLPYDGRKLGAMFDKLALPIPELMLFGKLMITRAEAQSLLKADRSIGSALLGLRLLGRYAVDRLKYRRGTRLVLGNALVARLLAACLENGVSVFTDVSVSGLVQENDRITGVSIGNIDQSIIADKGVVMAGGGYPSSAAWRDRELPKPVAEFSPAAPGCVGSTIALARKVGAVLGTSGIDNALWFPSSVMTRQDGSKAVYPHIVLDRAKPGSIIVNQSGNRFVNEAVSYHEFVRGMYRANGTETCIPAWMICSRNFIAKYGLGLIRPRTPFLGKYIKSGYLIEGGSLSELADKTGMPVDALEQTVAHFNAMAKNGKDQDFGRGETIYDRSNGDATHIPNPCLGVIENGPFYAVKLYPTPLGTSRGLATDTQSRVLDDTGNPIDGLYACGNDMQSAFGGEYPGAGAQLGQAMTFAWIAAHHAAGQEI
ncbi:fumarate reductase [Thalassospira profundimaris]|uniref:Fumarate reductase n=1 Tax=Thalassospira profundimaris TaxID=502049 RepID=A0A367W089_9PROT|nr:fumarate reductase [Thalassospira profundimaris]